MRYSAEDVERSAAAVRRQWSRTAQVGLILGTGLGHLADFLAADVELGFEQLPHFPRATALGHAGRLVCGELAGVRVAALRGRCHLYEGYSADQVALPVRVLHALGCRILIISNAAGGLNPRYEAGDIMVVADHINLMWRTPSGQRVDSPRPGRLAASPYDPRLATQAIEVARAAGFVLQAGVYVSMTGPTYETRAEYRMLRRIGGDCVGMSTIPEVLVARQCGLRVLALSTVTNVASPDAPQTVSGQQVVAAASRAEPRMRQLVTGLLARLAQEV
ncbi:MAG: purine-nucleoside phosphorylase [Pirellulaceae bacterium]|nr:purine-nucleoside phosphorylase [Pirellulaceae bacterium]